MADWFNIGAAGVSALGSLGGGILGANSAANVNAQQIAMQRDANFANLSFAKESLDNSNFQAHVNRDFQWKMSSSAYQRAVADMRAAGLNPMLAYSQGGASTSGGATGSSPVGAGQSGVSGLDNPGEYLGKGVAAAVQSAVETAKTLEGVKLMKEQAATQKTTQKLQEDQAAAAVAAANRDNAAAIASAKQAEKTDAEIRLVVPAMAGNYNAGAAAHSANAEHTRIRADRDRRVGAGVPAELSDTVEKIVRRLRDQKVTGEVPPPVSPSPFDRPYTGLKNGNESPLLSDTPTHWLYNPNRKR